MAGLIAALFGGKARPPDPDPLPGLGGVATGPGPDGEFGFPGSTSRTRSFQSRNPRNGVPGDWTGIRSETNSGWDSALSDKPQVRQASYRAEMGNKLGVGTGNNPRQTPKVITPQPQLTAHMQADPGTFFGGPKLKTGPGNDTAGGELSSRSAHNPRDTTTLYKDAQPVIGENTPGAENVRNTIAERYKNPPGQPHTYRPAPRADQAGVVPGGQAADGNVSNARAAQGEVTVQNRYVMFIGDGNQTWSLLREMPYGGRGNGARGADLNGQRYYATGQSDQFWNAGQGDYGIARQRGSQVKRPVSFTEPAPWTAQFYDTTDDIGTADNPNTNPGQQPQNIYISPSTGRASNSTGRSS